MIKRNLRNFDWILFGLVSFLLVISLSMLYSIDQFYFNKQIVWVALALIVIILGSQLDWSWFVTQRWFRYGFYFFSLLLLTIPFLQGNVIRGTKSWIVFGGAQFEPSEFVKVAIIMLFAGFFSKRYLAAWQGKNIFLSFIYAAIPAGIVALQPDMGSATVIISIWAGFLLMSGINKKRLLLGLLIAIIIFGLLWAFFLKPYQKDRLLAFVSPEIDPLGISYNVIQSKIAIGSAGFLGKGFGSGTQTQLSFLPESHTDFMFAALVEELGLLGGVVLVLTYFFLILRITVTGLKTRRNDSRFIVLGTGLVFFIHLLINIGSNIGLVPVMGISLPLVSYGGSNLLTSAILISIIERIEIDAAY